MFRYLHKGEDVGKLKKVLSIFGMLFLLSIAGIVGKNVANYFTGNKTIGAPLLDIVKVADEINKSCPFMVDSDIRMDNSIGVGKTLIYNYTLVNYTSSEIDTHVFRKNKEPTIKNKTCTTKELQKFFNNGITLCYRYYGKDGSHIVDIDVTPVDCGR